MTTTFVLFNCFSHNLQYEAIYTRTVNNKVEELKLWIHIT